MDATTALPSMSSSVSFTFLEWTSFMKKHYYSNGPLAGYSYCSVFWAWVQSSACRNCTIPALGGIGFFKEGKQSYSLNFVVAFSGPMAYNEENKNKNKSFSLNRGKRSESNEEISDRQMDTGPSFNRGFGNGRLWQ